MNEEQEFHSISALQHMAFCPRQAGLIHLEQVWAENRRTTEGRLLHNRVDEGYREFRKGLRQYSGIRVQSMKLGIAGRLDVLELEPISTVGTPLRQLLGLGGLWKLRPVEFKRGKPKEEDWDNVQLCAQAICLEEMTGQCVEEGAIFYGELRRRIDVPITEQLRKRTSQLVEEFDTIMKSKNLPSPVWKKSCKACSLLDICQPKCGDGSKAASYRKELFG